MDWAEAFYSTTGRWWGAAESGIKERDQDRVALVREFSGTGAATMLELGCGYGGTAAAAALDGFLVTGVDISSTRLEYANQYANVGGPGSPSFVQADFYAFETTGKFDVVSYWNGFGIGTDADQRGLLRLISERWLADGGRLIIDVANPLVWAGWAGDVSRRDARPEDGYRYSLTERTDFDPVACRFTDTWWEQDQPERQHTQTQRCYTPADFRLLLEGTGLTLAAARVAGAPVDLGVSHAGHEGLLANNYEWTAIMTAELLGEPALPISRTSPIVISNSTDSAIRPSKSSRDLLNEPLPRFRGRVPNAESGGIQVEGRFPVQRRRVEG